VFWDLTVLFYHITTRKKYILVESSKNAFYTNQPTSSKLARINEWLDAFLKFKQSKHQFYAMEACISK
jgi:hypothetical protein